MYKQFYVITTYKIKLKVNVINRCKHTLRVANGTSVKSDK